jgi:hypothetical protein
MPHTPFGSLIPEILNLNVFAVVGASKDPAKYGHMVYKTLKDAGYRVYPVNPNADVIDGDTVYPLLDNLPETPECVVTVVPPAVTETVARDAGRLGARYLWMQPGSESEAAVNIAHEWGLRTVYGGPCIMVAVKTRRTVGR